MVHSQQETGGWIVRSGLKTLVLKKAYEEHRTISNADISRETKITQNTVGSWMDDTVPLKRIEVSTLMALASWVPCDPRELLIIERVSEKA
jgi:DNA-binding Xre family transcriptional regulator